MRVLMNYTMHNPQQGHEVLTRALWPQCKAQLTAGKKLAVTVRELEDERTIKQHRFYRGPILGAIAAQASIEGQNWSQDAWHELFKRQFLPRQVTKCKVAGKKRPVVSVKIASTTGLSIKKMSIYLEKLIAFAATDLGVQFSEPSWERWGGMDMDIDPETGELR